MESMPTGTPQLTEKHQKYGCEEEAQESNNRRPNE